MAARDFTYMQALEKEVKMLFGSMVILSGGTVGTVKGGYTIVRNSVGNYTITNKDKYNRLLFASDGFIAPTIAGSGVQHVEIIANPATFQTDFVSSNSYTIQFFGVPSLASVSPLKTAANFAILADTAITNTGTSIVNGSVGIYPGTSITGFPPGIIVGATHNDDAVAQQAQIDAQAAFTSLQTLGLAGSTISSALDGQTLVPGAYKFSSGAATLAASGAGTLTLNGAGQYVIYTASTLTTGAGGIPTITLENGALAQNVFFVVGSSATINSGFAGVFQGNIIANVSITNTLGGAVNGSMVALTGAVTLSAASAVTVGND